MKKLKPAVVLLSGGQDSTTCLYWALQHFDKVKAVGFDYGQSHKQELIQAEKIANTVGVPYDIIPLKGILSGSSLLDGGDHNATHTNNETLPASFVPGRNLVFLTLTMAKYLPEGIHDIVTGVCQTDYSGYPDCRDETIKSLARALTMGTDESINIHTPLMWLTKAETWKLAKDLGCIEVIINDTLTDYNGDMTQNEWGKGRRDNPASELRAKGYYEAKQKGWLQ